MSVNLCEVLDPKVPTIGGRVRVTRSVWDRAAPVGTVGILWKIGEGVYSEEHGRMIGQLSILREDGEGIGWCEAVEPWEGER